MKKIYLRTNLEKKSYLKNNPWRQYLITTIVITPLISNPITTDYDSLIHAIEDNGFENVQLTMENKHFRIAYENRIYQSEMKAFGIVLKTLLSTKNNADSITVTPMNRRIPLSSISLHLNDYQSFIYGNSDNTTFSSQISVSMADNSGNDNNSSTYPQNSTSNKLVHFL